METLWASVDAYFEQLLLGEDKILQEVLENCERAGLPAYQVSPCQGKLLQLMVCIQRAGRILELGTLGGYSTICMARALKAPGRIITVEFEPKHAAVARRNFELSGFKEQISLIEGDARTTLESLIHAGTEPFDLIFIDADKQNMPVYLELSLALSRPGTLLIGDNVVRKGEVVNAETRDPGVLGARKFCERLSANPELESTAIQTVGCKGYDGFTISRVKG